MLCYTAKQTIRDGTLTHRAADIQQHLSTTPLRLPFIYRPRPRTRRRQDSPHQPVHVLIHRIRLLRNPPLVHETLLAHSRRPPLHLLETQPGHHKRDLLPPGPRPPARHPARTRHLGPGKFNSHPDLRLRQSHPPLHRVSPRRQPRLRRRPRRHSTTARLWQCVRTLCQRASGGVYPHQQSSTPASYAGFQHAVQRHHLDEYGHGAGVWYDFQPLGEKVCGR